MKLRAQATLSTRPEKQVRSLAELTRGVARARSAGARAGCDEHGRALHPRMLRTPVLRAEDMPLDVDRTRSARSVMQAVSEKRATWRHWNLAAEAARQTMGSGSQRRPIARPSSDSSSMLPSGRRCALTPPELASEPGTRSSAMMARRSSARSTPSCSPPTELLDAEERLLERAAESPGRRVALTTLREVARRRLPRRRSRSATISSRRSQAIVGSGRVVDVLVGPAGAGKTTRDERASPRVGAEHGAGSVIGLAPSAAAAHVLAEDLGIATENLAKWWHEPPAHTATTFRPGQLVIIDEASLAGTLAARPRDARSPRWRARRCCSSATTRNCSPSMQAARSRCWSTTGRDAPEARRRAPLRARVGEGGIPRPAPRRSRGSIDRYLAHDRVREGDTEAMADAAYLAWRADARAGRATVLISDSNEAVAALNLRARTELILDGRVDALREVALHDGTRAVRRRHGHHPAQRSPAARRTGWVRNGDRWTVARRAPERLARGAAARAPVGEHRRAAGRRTSGEHVELGYAVTAHRAQGITTDTAHVVVASGTTRENLYVAMTRGREANTAYVAIDRPDVAHAGPRPGDDGDATARSVLFGVLQHVGAELSAHETLAAEQERGDRSRSSRPSTRPSRPPRSTTMGGARARVRAHAEQADAAIESDAFGPLTAELRRAEAAALRRRATARERGSRCAGSRMRRMSRQYSARGWQQQSHTVPAKPLPAVRGGGLV